MLLTDQFAELLYEFYEMGISSKELSMKEFLDEMTEKLEMIILQNA